MTKVRAMIIAAGCAACFGFGWLFWLAASDKDLGWGSLMGVCFAASLASFYGLWRLRKWALVLSRCVAIAAFGVGCYLVNFAWTFWIFQTPTFMDRILAVLRPQISPFIILPAVWWMVSFTPHMKEQFHGHTGGRGL